MDNAKSIGVVFTHNDPLRTATLIVSGQYSKNDLNLHAAATLVKQSGSAIVIQLGDNITRIATDYGDLFVVNPPVDHDAITAAYALCTEVNTKLVHKHDSYSISHDAPDVFSLIHTTHIPMCDALFETVVSGRIGAVQLALVGIIGKL